MRTELWTPIGTSLRPDVLGSFQPEEVHFEYDCTLLSLTTRSPSGQPLHWHWLSCTRSITRYLVVEVAEGAYAAAQEKNLLLRELLQSGPCYLADIANDDTVQAVWSVKFEDIPNEFLPVPAAAVWPAKVN